MNSKGFQLLFCCFAWRKVDGSPNQAASSPALTSELAGTPKGNGLSENRFFVGGRCFFMCFVPFGVALVYY